MMVREKKLPNKALDFFIGFLGLIGLIIQLVRQNDNEISWKHYVGGFAAATLASILLISACVAAFDDAVEEAWETDVSTCHYDSTTNLSLVISGSLGNSRSDYYQGNVCD